MAVYDPIRAEQERIQNDLQNAQAEQARQSPNVADKASARARKKSGRDRIRASARGHQDVVEQYQARYTGGATPTARPAKAAKMGTGWVLEGTYGTKADANIVRRNYKDTHFVRVLRLSAGGYNVWIKERGDAVSGKVAKSYNLDRKISEFKGTDRRLAPPSEAHWASFGTLPEYKPPNFQLDKSGYKPLDYKPIDNTPMFKYSGFKTMDYKPIGSEPYYKPYEYRPIGQFGSVINNPPNISGLQRPEPKKRKKKKSKEPRLVGE